MGDDRFFTVISHPSPSFFPSRPVSRILYASFGKAAGRVVIIYLGALLLTLSRSLPGRITERAAPHAGSRLPSSQTFRPAWPCSRWGLPGQRHHCRCRWSLTPPFHPRQPRTWALNGQSASLLHLPSGHPARPLAGTVPCGVRTFLSSELAEPRSPGLLGILIVLMCKPDCKSQCGSR